MTSRLLGIIGDGPRLTYVLNALSVRANELQDLAVLVVHASATPGAGWVHDPGLPTGFTMNRQSRDLSFGPDASCRGWEGLSDNTTTLATWLAGLGVPRAFPDDFPPRAVHGAALRAAFSESLKTLRLHVPVKFVRGFADRVDCYDGRFITVRGNFEDERIDECLLLTGHGDRPDFHRLFDKSPRDGRTTVVGGGATGLDMIVHQASQRHPRASPIQHLSRSRLGIWPRPRRAATMQLTPITTPFLDRAEAAANLTTRELLGYVVAEILHSYSHLAGFPQMAHALGLAAMRAAMTPDPSRSDLHQTLMAEYTHTQTLSVLGQAPWEAIDVLLRRPGPPRDKDEDLAVRLAAAERGYGEHPGVTAVEFVLRDQRPRWCALTAPDRISDRSNAFSHLVGAMNILVNGPAPATAQAYSRLRREGAIEMITDLDSMDAMPVIANVSSLMTDPRPGPLKGCLESGVARVGVEFMVGDYTHTRVAVDARMALDGPQSDGRIYALGPHVDSGELLHASAMRPGCDHTVMREITQWLQGLVTRIGHPTERRAII